MRVKYGFIGFGNLSKAIVKGLSSEEEIFFSYFSKTNQHKEIEAKDSLESLISWADVVVLGIKPQEIENVLGSVDKELFCDKLILSPVAGLKVSRLESILGKDKAIVRIMPNMAVAYKQAVIAFYSNTKSVGVEALKGHLETLGKLVEVDEIEFDLFTAIFGSGPAFLLEILASMKDKIREFKNISQADANLLLLQLLKGTLSYLESYKEKDIKELIQNIASKGGTTEAGLLFFHKNNLDSLFQNVFSEAEKRSIELSNS